jgi:hypothetical protein
MSAVSGTWFFADSKLSVSEPIVTDFRYCQLRARGDAGDPARRNRRHLCPHKESHYAGAMRLNRTAQVDTIEELVVINISVTSQPRLSCEIRNVV